MYAVVNGVQTNALPFTVRTDGSIHFSLISFFLDEMYPFIMCRTRERILPAKQVIITKSKSKPYD